MKWQMLAGIILAGLGAFIVLRGLSYGSGRSVVRVGDFQASVEEQRAIPTWVGGVAIVGGLLLVGASSVRRRTPSS
jgi:drug/metabolite transporter (DMT)-like permease